MAGSSAKNRLLEAHGKARPGRTIEWAGDRASESTPNAGLLRHRSNESKVGQLDVAAGVDGSSRRARRARRGTDQLHYEQPNPRIELASSPFLSHALAHAKQPGRAAPRGVNSSGWRHQCHVVLEEAPAARGTPPSPWQLLPLSAHSERWRRWRAAGDHLQPAGAESPRCLSPWPRPPGFGPQALSPASGTPGCLAGRPVSPCTELRGLAGPAAVASSSPPGAQHVIWRDL